MIPMLKELPAHDLAVELSTFLEVLGIFLVIILTRQIIKGFMQMAESEVWIAWLILIFFMVIYLAGLIIWLTESYWL